MSKKAIIWIILIIVAGAAIYWYFGLSSSTEPLSIKGDDGMAQAVTSTSSQAKTSDIVPNAIILPSTSATGGTAVFEQAPAGTEKGGKNPPITDKPVVAPSGTTAPSQPYKAPVTDRPVI